MKLNVFPAFFALIVCVLVVAADDPAKPASEPQSRVEPRSAPGEGQNLLERFAGDWRVAKAFYPREGEPTRAEGTCRHVMIHGGRFLQSDFVFLRDGVKTTGQGLIGFEPESSTFTSVWTDSRQTRMSIRQSRDPFDGARIVLYSKSLDPSDKPAFSTKTITRLSPDGQTLSHRQYLLDPSGGERLMMELTMTRQTSPATPAPN
jgi:hypothetical protein